MTTEAAFLKDVDQHVMFVIVDDHSTTRRIRFRRPDTMCMHFDLITWPGHLCYTGDMGTYVFSRLDDMFEFFRKEPGRSIDFRYWAEKLLAVDSSGGKGSVTEFSKERFTQVINEYKLKWVRDRTQPRLTKVQRRDLWETVDNEVLRDLDEGEHAVYARANEFNHSVWLGLNGTKEIFSFDNLWDHRFTEHTSHFLWCCHALAWGIRKYDESKP